MKVIFTDSVKGVALKGDTKNVKRGFFRNYLLPRGKAVLATNALVKEWEERRKRMMIAKEELRAKLEETKARLAGAKLKIEKKVTAKGTLYGGVKAADIVKALKSSLKLEMPETAVVFGAPIKAVGEYEVKLNLGEGVEATVLVTVIEKK